MVGVQVSGVGMAGVLPAVPFRCPHGDPAQLAAWAGRPLSQDLHATFVCLTKSHNVRRRWARLHRSNWQTVKLCRNQATPRYSIVVLWESGSSGRFRDWTLVGGLVRLLKEWSPPLQEQVPPQRIPLLERRSAPLGT